MRNADSLETVVIVGASLAGLRAAEALREKNYAGRIVMIGAEPHLPYDRPPLSKRFLAGRVEKDRLFLRSAEKLAELGLELRLGVRATELFVDKHGLSTSDGDFVSYDGLVIATGATPRWIPGSADLAGVHTLRGLDDAEALRKDLSSSGCRLVVVGAGFLGLEVAGTARELGAHVTVVEPLASPLGRVLPVALGGVLLAEHKANGVEIRTGVGVTSIFGSDAPEEVELSTGERLSADVVLVAVGVVPETAWLEGSGLELEDGVVCDECLRAGPDIVAAGDVARWPLSSNDIRPARLEHWTNAAEQGAHAALTLLQGRDATPFKPVPYLWSDQLGLKIQALGRLDPQDVVEVVDGSLEARRFVACLSREGELHGVLSIGRPRQLMAFRPLLERGASMDEARALELV